MASWDKVGGLSGVVDVVAPLKNGSSTELGDTQATGSDAFAAGLGAVASGEDSISVGSASSAAGARSLVVGRDSVADGDDSIAVGAYSHAKGKRSITIGRSTFAATYSTVIGYGNVSSYNAQALIGYMALGCGTGNVSVGYESLTFGNSCVAIGFDAHMQLDPSFDVNAKQPLANASNPYHNNVALGAWSSVPFGETNVVSVGNGADAAYKNVRRATDNDGNLTQSAPFWETCDVSVPEAVRNIRRRIIYVADPRDDSDAATKAYVDKAVSAIPMTISEDATSMAIGDASSAAGTMSTAVGSAASANANGTVVIGSNAVTSTTAENGIAIGYNAAVYASGSVSIGYNSEANSSNEFSVGSSELLRRVSHVSYPVNDTDAATKLYVEETVSENKYELPVATAEHIGGVRGHALPDGVASVSAYIDNEKVAVPAATASAIGVVKPGTGLSVASDGTMSADATVMPRNLVWYQDDMTGDGITGCASENVAFLSPYDSFHYAMSGGGKFTTTRDFAKDEQIGLKFTQLSLVDRHYLPQSDSDVLSGVATGGGATLIFSVTGDLPSGTVVRFSY